MSVNNAEVKKDILWRVYLGFIVLFLLGGIILYKAVVIQKIEGAHWRELAKKMHQKDMRIEPERGTIYSEDKQMLSTSVPQYDVYIDFGAEGLRENAGKLFRQHVDSLSICLANLFGDYSAAQYNRLLKAKYQEKDRYFLLQKKVSFRQYETMKQFPLVRLGRNKSGFIATNKSFRLNPYQLLAYRTVGLERENAQKVGIEQAYDTYLRGVEGKQLVRFIGGGYAVPVDEEPEIEPENGSDVYTSLNIHIQEITENALMKMMLENEAEHGCAIVMEVATGKIKAVANLGKVAPGKYWENMNYALQPSEPGSTFKLATLLTAFETGKVNQNTVVNLEGGTWSVGGRTVYDSEKHGRYEVTTKRAFELSSNVGMAKIALQTFGNNPSKYIQSLQELGFTSKTGIDISGEGSPIIFTPASKYWSNTTLPWMSFGYNLTISPLRTAMLYNAVANNGTMMKPYLVTSIQREAEAIKQFEPTVVKKSICSPATLAQLKSCLAGTTTEEGATAFALFKNSPYTVAGKTGTALVAEGKLGYSNHVYQSSFAGYFPANNPKYTIVVVIKNKPNAAKIYGALVAGPVFKEISDRLYTLFIRGAQSSLPDSSLRADSTLYNYTLLEKHAQQISKKLGVQVVGNTSKRNEFVEVSFTTKAKASVKEKAFSETTVPQVQGMVLKDALYACERIGLQVKAVGKGRVAAQNKLPGATYKKGEVIELILK